MNDAVETFINDLQMHTSFSDQCCVKCHVLVIAISLGPFASLAGVALVSANNNI